MPVVNIKGQCFCPAEVVKNDAFEKSLRLVISSKMVDRKKFVEALEERLAPKLDKV